MIQYGYFDSVDGDRRYNADQMSEYFDGLVSNGVYENVGNAMVVTAGSGMDVTVGSGRAIINCKWMKIDGSEPVTVTQSEPQFNRYSAIVIRLNADGRKMELACRDGEPGIYPVKPTIPDTELCLAWVRVRGAMTSILQSDIEDARGTDVCGWVTGLIEQVDTSTLFLQWQDACERYFESMTEQFNDWLSGLTQRLNVNTFIENFEKRYVEETGGSYLSLALNMTGYKYESSDIIQVYVNGLLCTDGVEYTLALPEDDSQTAYVNTEFILDEGTEIKVVVLKSVLGFKTLMTAGGLALVTSDGLQIRRD